MASSKKRPGLVKNQAADRGNLDSAPAELLRRSMTSSEALQTALFGLCWPNESTLVTRLGRLELRVGETLQEGAERARLPWSPQWLLDAGHRAADGGGNAMGAHERAAVAGAVSWDPAVRLCRLDDQIKDDDDRAAGDRRLAGEVAVAALWRHAALAHGIDCGDVADVRPTNMNGNTRGAILKNALVYVLRLGLPPTWTVEGEVKLEQIYGLHMRRNVGDRSSDIAVFDDDDRLMAIISSKWTWRTDRGTEAAQMVHLNRYRPEVPYVLVTAEFPRVKSIAQESVEDRVYVITPRWVAAFHELRMAGPPAGAAGRFPTLDELIAEADKGARLLGLEDVARLVLDLNNSGRRG